MNARAIRKKLHEMVLEDRGSGDITSEFTPNKQVTAEIIVKEPCTVTGIPEVKMLFSLFKIKPIKHVKEGTRAKRNQKIFLFSGKSRDILCVERTALNILSRMSGISTLTAEIVTEARRVNPKIRIAATRKTTPLFGYFEKQAVKRAGGETHRLGLWDAVLIKDNHLKLFGSVSWAVKKARDARPSKDKIEVETKNPKEALEAARAGADTVMLDNFRPKEIVETLKLIKNKKINKRIIFEASGGITGRNVGKYARTGVDILSLGSLTHSAKGKDFSLNIL